MSNLQEAFREATRREFAMVPAESELDYSFSPGFQRKMRRIIRAQVHGYWQFVNTTAKRVACVAAIIVMLVTTAMAIKPIRERVIKFFVEVYEEYFEITFGKTDQEDIDPTPKPMTRYSFAWIPEGYSETNYLEFDSLLQTFWQNGNGDIISLFQGIGSHHVTLDRIDKMPSTFQYETLNITHQTYDNTETFIWEQHGYVFLLSVYEDVVLDQSLQMISSLVEAPKLDKK